MRPRRLNLFVSIFLTGALMSSALATSASALPEKFFGMNAHEQINESAPDWDALQKAGVQRFRMQVKWLTVNEAGNWRTAPAWEATYDRYFKNAAQHGIEILPYLYTRKTGARAYYLTSEKSNYKEWLEFVELFAARYGQNGSFWVYNPSLPQYPVKTWEVWNEPNLGKNCPSEKCDGQTYGEFLVGTSAAIHAAQSGYSPVVLFGGIYMEAFEALPNPITSFLKKAAKAPGINSAYDGLSIHPYALGNEGGSRSEAQLAAGVRSNIVEAGKAQGEAGLPSKPLWVTEVGWPVAGEGAQSVSPDEQAGLLNETYNWLKENWATYNVKYAAWYFYKDISGEPNWAGNAGLRASNGAFRPSWWVYQAQTGTTPWPGGQMAFQANTNQLFVFSTGTGAGNTGFGMAASTSPSVTTLGNGEWVSAFQSSGNQLWIRLGSTEYGNTGFGMATGTSPSITTLQKEGHPTEEWVIAFQSNGSQLWTRRSNTAYENTLFGMAPGTSPSVAPFANGEYVMAFQSNGNQLWTRRSNGAFENTSLGMAPGTSPSVAMLANGEYVMAFQSNGNQLCIRRSNGAFENTGLGMAAGTSPSIATLPGSEYIVAFQANTGSLWTKMSSGSVGNWEQGMRGGTSPSVTGLARGGYEIAFQANTSELIAVGTSGGTTTKQGMAAGTSPSISSPSRWAN